MGIALLLGAWRFLPDDVLLPQEGLHRGGSQQSTKNYHSSELGLAFPCDPVLELEVDGRAFVRFFEAFGLVSVDNFLVIFDAGGS